MKKKLVATTLAFLFILVFSTQVRGMEEELQFHDDIVPGATFKWNIETLSYSGDFTSDDMNMSIGDYVLTEGDVIKIEVTADPNTLDWESESWLNVYNNGELGIYLPDTFGLDAFLKTFDYKMRLNWIITSLKNLKKYPGIVLADVGGGRPDVGIRVTDENYEILKLCDYAVIVSRNDKNQINAWLDEIRQKLPELKIIACYESVYNPEGLYNFSNDNAIWHLDRTAYANGLIPEPTLQKIRKLADKILSL